MAFPRLRSIHGRGKTPAGEPRRYLFDVVVPYRGDDCLIWPYAKNTSGYGHLTLDGRQITVSRYVCIQINGDPPSAEYQAAHTCGKGKQGCVSPLHMEWKTARENYQDRLVHGTHARGSRSVRAKLTDEQVAVIRSLRGQATRREISARFNVCRAHISKIWSGESWAD